MSNAREFWVPVACEKKKEIQNIHELVHAHIKQTYLSAQQRNMPRMSAMAYDIMYKERERMKGSMHTSE